MIIAATIVVNPLGRDRKVGALFQPDKNSTAVVVLLKSGSGENEGPNFGVSAYHSWWQRTHSTAQTIGTTFRAVYEGTAMTGVEMGA